MGERGREAFRVDFDRSVKIDFRGARVTGDAGLLAFRELDEALGLTGMAAEFLTDTRTARSVPIPVPDPLTQVPDHCDATPQPQTVLWSVSKRGTGC